MKSLFEQLRTPAFLLSEKELGGANQEIYNASRPLGLAVFYPLKTQAYFFTLDRIKKNIAGFSASSLFETRLAREIAGLNKKIHFTSPGLREDELDELIELCDGISFNSSSQWERFKQKAIGKVDCALRINPQLSFVKDKRYDPSRKHSRLGIPLDQIVDRLKSDPGLFKEITGLHFHTNCDSEDFSPILKTVEHLDKKIPDLLKQCKWINLGGGYLFDEESDLKPFEEAVQLLQDKYALEVIIEPGASVVREACYLVSSVIDLIESDGMQIAVLDTTVNHMPEVFEYQYRPDILNESENGQYSYILEGATCLAGDRFGDYTFDKPLEIGSKIVFTGMGAYTMVKAHTFNGINLPSVYSLADNGELILQKEYTYEEFRKKCGAEENHESIRKTTASECSPRKQRTA